DQVLRERGDVAVGTAARRDHPPVLRWHAFRIRRAIRALLEVLFAWVTSEGGRVDRAVGVRVLRRLAYGVEVEVVGRLLGRPHDQLSRLTELVDDLARCRRGLAPHDRRTGDPAS